VCVYPGDMPPRNHIKLPSLRAAGVFKTPPGMEGQVLKFELLERVVECGVHGSSGRRTIAQPHTYTREQSKLRRKLELETQLGT
jgi:hypothetical protein